MLIIRMDSMHPLVKEPLYSSSKRSAGRLREARVVKRIVVVSKVGGADFANTLAVSSE